MFLTYGNSSAMGFWNLVLHLANFALPALVLAALLAPAVVGWRGLSVRDLWLVWRWLALAGLLVLLAGLVAFGRDGKMVSYVLLVLTVGTVACWLQWRHARASLAARTVARRSAGG